MIEVINNVSIRRERVWEGKGEISLKSQRRGIPRFIHLLCVFTFGIYLICIQL
jgi:hypothetical protein